MTERPRPVVAAAILDSLHQPTRLLCAARAYPESLVGQFELPGGKVEPGEAPVDALSREIREELCTHLTLGPRVDGPDQGWWPILQGRRMEVWLAQVAPGAPQPVRGPSHLELRWVPLDHVDTLAWIGHDLPIAVAAVDLATRHHAESADRPAAPASRRIPPPR